jgi:alpha-tubulin suppressor-like RCC1 family protein
VNLGGAAPLTALALGGDHSCGINSNFIVCWGKSRYGQVAGLTEAQPDPIGFFRPFGGIKAIAAGAEHTCVINESGELFCKGWNIFQQIAPTNSQSISTFTHIAVGERFDTVTAGVNHTCGITVASGFGFGGPSALCWGYNSFGQLGDGTTTARNASAPANIIVPGPPLLQFVGWSQISAGWLTTCGLAGYNGQNGYCWGDSTYSPTEVK